MKLQPVRWMTWVLVILSTFTGSAELVDLLPDAVVGWMMVTIAVLTAILGTLARGAVTPLAKPRDAVGTPLVPVSRR